MINEANTAVTTAPAAAQPAGAGFLATLKTKLNLDALMAKLNLTSEKMLEVGAYLGIGFFTGFLFKKYFKYLFIIVVSVILAVVGLEYVGVIKVDWIGLRSICGLQRVDSVDTVVNTCLAWVRVNLALVLSWFVGFLIGYKVG